LIRTVVRRDAAEDPPATNILASENAHKAELDALQRELVMLNLSMKEFIP
jgi:hypothetical protein